MTHKSTRDIGKTPCKDYFLYEQLSCTKQDCCMLDKPYHNYNTILPHSTFEKVDILYSLTPNGKQESVQGYFRILEDKLCIDIGTSILPVNTLDHCYWRKITEEITEEKPKEQNMNTLTYLAGAITNDENFKRKFDACKTYLYHEHKNITVLCPTDPYVANQAKMRQEVFKRKEPSHADYMASCIGMLSRAESITVIDCIYLDTSSGTKMEISIAKNMLHLPINVIKYNHTTGKVEKIDFDVKSQVRTNATICLPAENSFSDTFVLKLM